MSFNINSRGLRFSAISLFILAAAVAIYAQARPSVKVKLVGTVLRAGKEMTLAEAKSVRPGEILNWTLTSRNEGSATADAPRPLLAVVAQSRRALVVAFCRCPTYAHAGQPSHE